MIIKLPLTKKAKALFSGHFSSADYNELMLSLLMPLDLVYTYFFRYDRVVENDMGGNGSGNPVPTQGGAIDFSSVHPAVTIAITGVFSLLALSSFLVELRRQSLSRDNKDHLYILSEFDIQTKLHNIKLNTEHKKFDMNYYLEKLVREDEELNKKYHSIKLDIQNGTLDFDFREAEKSKKLTLKEKMIKAGKDFLHKVVHPIWTSLTIASFVYWILWIGVGIFTGDFSTGITGIPVLVSFGLPILSGLAYPFLKMFNYFRKVPSFAADTVKGQEKEEAAKTIEATESTCSLFRRALLSREYDLKKERIKNELADYPEATGTPKPEEDLKGVAVSIDKQIMDVGKNKWKKTAVTIISAAGGTYVAAQYGSWIITDFLSIVANVTIAIPLVNLILGTVLLAGSALYGIYKGYQRYQEVKAHEESVALKEIAKQQQLENLELRLANLQTSIVVKQAKLGLPVTTHGLVKYNEEQFFENIYNRGPSKWTQTKKVLKRALQFFNGFCTGAFIARIFFVKGTVVALPFVAAALSNPVTIGILVGVGVLYGAVKLYQYHQDRKEQRAVAMLAQRQERLVCLKQQIDLAELENKLLSAKEQRHYAQLRVAANDEVIRPPSPDTVSSLSPVTLSSAGLFSQGPRSRSLSRDDDVPEFNAHLSQQAH
jgi:hypothetical protein